VTGPRIGSLFSGYGGLDMGVQMALGGTVAWHCEVDQAPARVLAHHWPDVPNLGDITAVDWDTVEPVDVLTGGYPCQPFSHAGKRKGNDDPRHLWPHMLRAIRVLRPRIVIAENVRGHLGLGFADVLADLADVGGYEVRWLAVRAADVGAPHRRERLFWVASAADADEPGPQGQPGHPPRGHGESGPSASGHRGDAGRFGPYAAAVARWEQVTGQPAPPPTEPHPKTGRSRLAPVFVEWLMGLPVGHVTDVPNLTYGAQLKILGNGVVPQQAALALRMLFGAAP